MIWRKLARRSWTLTGRGWLLHGASRHLHLLRHILTVIVSACQRHRNLLGLGFKLKKGQLTRLPDPAILELECIACHQIHKKMRFASSEMQVAINEDHSTTAGIPGLERKGSLTPRALFNLTHFVLILISAPHHLSFSFQGP